MPWNQSRSRSDKGFRRLAEPPLQLVLTLLLLTLACSTTTPRVLEVSSWTHLKDIDAVDEELFAYDQASRIQYQTHDLDINDQREEFYVRWSAPPTSGSGSGPASVDQVKFEYRQMGKPNTIFEQDFVPHGESSKVFAVRGEDFRSGGSVTAWRVSLWDGDQLVAEKKSFLW
jgi:hypothetical protein